MRTFAPLLLALFVAACTTESDSARGVAESFIDEHYVRMDLQAALQHTTGLAKHKVEEEIRLVGDQEIDGETMRPSVTYEIEEERAAGEDRSNLVYRGKVSLSGGDAFEMRWLINARREGGAWKVSNYEEMQ